MQVDLLSRRALRPLVLAGTAALSAPCSAQNAPLSLEEIVVTATRRPEELSKVPISITAFSNEDMERLTVRDVGDVARFTPGLTFKDAGVSNTISIRGIVSSVGFATTGVYIDDTIVPIRSNNLYTTGTAFPKIFDLERVEVLRGPQGTLFGAGTLGGAVRFITRQPSLTEFTASGRAEFGVTEHGESSYEGGFALNGPLKEDKLGAYVSAWHRHSGGYIDHQSILEAGIDEPDSNWEETTVVRAALTIAPSERLRIKPSIFFQDFHAHDASTYNEAWSDPDAGRFRNQNVLRTPRDDRFYLPAVEVSLDLANMKFTSLSSYFNRTNPNVLDYTEVIPALLGLSPFPTGPGQDARTFVRADQDIWTQEFRLQSADDAAKVRWTLGAFYSRTRIDTYQNAFQPYLETLIDDLIGLSLEQVFGVGLINGGYVFDGRVVSHDEQTAGFAEVDYRLTPRLTLTGGVRVTKTKFDFTQRQDGVFAGGHQLASGAQSETPVTPKVAISYQINDDNLLYVSAAKGFRMGGVNPQIAATPGCNAQLADLGLGAVPTTYDSDSTWNYEIGSKNTLFDHRLTIDSSIYYIDWRDIQRSVYLPLCGQGFTANLGSATSAGAELSLRAQLSTNLALSLAVGYNDAKLDETIASGSLVLVQKDTPMTAPWMGAVAADYTFGVWGGHDAYLHLDFTHRDRDPRPRSGAFSFDPALIVEDQPRDQELNARVGVRLGRFDVSVFVNNALDDHPVYNRSHTTPASPLFESSTLRPRTIGLTTNYRF